MELSGFDGGVSCGWLPVGGPFECMDASKGERIEQEEGVGL